MAGDVQNPASTQKIEIPAVMISLEDSKLLVEHMKVTKGGNLLIYSTKR